MATLCIKPSGLEEKHDRPWQLVLRTHDLAGTDYEHVAWLTDDKARDVIEAGAPSWLFGKPDWEQRAKARALERARVLREQADAIISANI